MEVQPGIKRNAVLCVLRNQQHLLLLKRAKDPHKGFFTPVGGKIDPFENPSDAAIRECREETGIDLPQMQYVGSLVESSPTDYNWNCLVYLADIPRIPPPTCPEGELFWIGPDQFADIPTPESDRWIYQYVQEGKPFFFNMVYDQELHIVSFREELEGIAIRPKAQI